MEDSLRLSNLKEKMDKMSYWTKPKLNETQILKDADRSRPIRSTSARERGKERERSASASGRFGQSFRDKYSHVKPKTITRLGAQTARAESEISVGDSQQDIMNDSLSIRSFQ